MVSLIRDLVTERGWLTANEFLDFVAVAESTPGPLAVNMATFVGASQAGFSGALVATIGVVLPSFLIILLISALLNNLLKFAGVQAFLRGVRPAVTGLICATAVTMLLEVVFGVQAIGKLAPQDVRPIAIFALRFRCLFMEEENPFADRYHSYFRRARHCRLFLDLKQISVNNSFNRQKTTP